MICYLHYHRSPLVHGTDIDRLCSSTIGRRRRAMMIKTAWFGGAVIWITTSARPLIIRTLVFRYSGLDNWLP